MDYILTLVFGVLSSVLCFILNAKIREVADLKHEKEQRNVEREKALENGVVCILRKHLMDEHEIWTRRGFITPKALESSLLMYKAYKALGGNGMIDHMEEEIQELPIKD